MNMLFSWRQLAYVMVDIPSNTLLLAQDKIEFLARKFAVESQQISAVDVMQLIDCHRVAYILAKIHNKNPLSVIKSYNYWCNYLHAHDRTANRLEQSDLLGYTKDHVIRILWLAIILKPNKWENAEKVCQLEEKLMYVGWSDVADALVYLLSSNVNPYADSNHEVCTEIQQSPSEDMAEPPPPGLIAEPVVHSIAN